MMAHQQEIEMNQATNNASVVSDWQTQLRGSNDQEYQIYLACADDGKGIDFTTGDPLKTYDQWIAA
jgi:hypothetical protein